VSRRAREGSTPSLRTCGGREGKRRLLARKAASTSAAGIMEANGTASGAGKSTDEQEESGTDRHGSRVHRILGLPGDEHVNVKQVIIIRKDLHMRRGKEIAQGSHASIAFLTNRLLVRTKAIAGDLGGGAVTFADFTAPEWEWIQGNFRKICVVVNSEEELLEIVRKAKEAGLVAEPIEDSGLTEFGGKPTLTAAAIGPDYDEKIDPVTGHLVLY
jgi:PTH2 family peptidyl-tRNA hydrolase